MKAVRNILLVLVIVILAVSIAFAMASIDNDPIRYDDAPVSWPTWDGYQAPTQGGY